MGAAVAAFAEDGLVEFLDFREKEGCHVFRGQISDLEAAARDVRSVLDGLGGLKIANHTPVHLVLAHEKIKRYEFETSLHFGPEHDLITETDIEKVQEQTQRVLTIPLDERVFSRHVQEYMVNDLSGIRNPLGLYGQRLAGRLAFFTLPDSTMRHIERVLEINRIEPGSWYPRASAAARAIFRDEWMRRGGLLIYVGSSLTELVGFDRFNVCWYESIPVGIETIASLLKEARAMEPEVALAVTKEYAAFGSRPHGEEMIPFRQSNQGAQGYLPSYEFNRYLEEGVAKIADQLIPAIERARSSFNQLPKVVLTGEHAAVNSVIESLEKRCAIPLEAGRIQRPGLDGVFGKSPRFVPLAGRVILLRDEENERLKFEGRNVIERMTGRLATWMRDNF